MISYDKQEVWFITGSQHLYGVKTLEQVAEHARKIARHLNGVSQIPIRVLYKKPLSTPDEILQLCLDANTSNRCVGLVIWMHTFSPSKMWINGLKILHKPMLHLHTQFNSDIPWNTIDMNFMNLNQSAHGGREFGFMNTRLGINRKVVVGYWKDEEVIERISIWTRVAVAWKDSSTMKIARFGDNMRDVAVTEGNQVSAQIKFGYSVQGYGLEEISTHIKAARKKDILKTVDSYLDEYEVVKQLMPKGRQHKSLIEAARIEVGLRSFLAEGDFMAFTDTFENLAGLTQLPGIAVQRLMSEGYGFGAEGDWKTAGLVRSMKVMAHGLPGGNSFMEDYTYHMDGKQMMVLGAHMLEICPSIAGEKPSCQIHPLSIGGKAQPVRLVFTGSVGPALNASMIDLGNRFRMVVNNVDAISPPKKFTKLPVARVLWQPHPNLKIGAAAWILAGGSHHTCFSQNLSKEYLQDFAEIADIECAVIDEDTSIQGFKQMLRTNEVFYHFRQGFR